MYLHGRSLRLRKAGRLANSRRIILLLVLILGGLLVVSLRQQGLVQPLFIPTLAPTRIPQVYADEAEAQFAAGNLKAAVAAYRGAVQADPKNLNYWVAMARVQIFAQQYDEALASAGNALMVSPNDAKARAIYAWALDWNVAYGCRCKTLAEAESAAVTAIALDSNYAPAHAYYSEILNDAGKWNQGFTEAETALRLAPNLLEAERALGYANESVGNYEGAIEHYKAALKINPNLISVYLALGLNYRVLLDYEQAIFYFSKANAIDPQNIDPYLYLSRTYYQNDELGTAIQYLQQALNIEPDNPDIHGRLGLILFKRRNYEGAEPELRLAVLGGKVDGLGNPLLDSAGVPLNDASGNAVASLDANGNPVVLDANGQPVTGEDGKVLDVQPLPLSGSITLEYYYTYGNLLAFLKQCKPNQAPRILQLALNYRPDDPTVKGSYDESMAICAGTLTADEAINGTATPVGASTPVIASAPISTATPADQPASSGAADITPTP